MKQETIENIKWLKDLLDREAEIEPVCKNDEEFVSNYKKRCEECKQLLDSLEGLENQLKHGGFIPDRNGKPCKDGDRVKIFANDEKTTGTVKWISDCGYFLICSDGEDSYNWYLDELRDCGHGWFEKED